LNFKNRHCLPIEITSLSLNESTAISLDENLILDTKAESVYEFTLPKYRKWTEEMLQEVTIYYRLLGSQTEPTVLKIRRDINQDATSFLEVTQDTANQSSALLRIDEKRRIITIPSDTLLLSENVMIPEGYQLHVKAGTVINLTNNASLTSFSPIFCDGEESNPIRFMSSAISSSGLSIIDAKERSIFNYVIFQGFDNMSADPRNSAIITIVGSPVEISNCIFRDCKSAGHLLYCSHSEFLVVGTLFQGITGTAFVGDRSHGTINHTSFLNISQSAITSFDSEIDLEAVFMNGIGSEGITATNNSNISAHFLEIQNVLTAISASDWSSLIFSDVKVINGQVGLSTMKNDQVAGPAQIKCERIVMEQVKRAHKITEQSSIILNGRLVEMD
jgi:hypothetical protein